MRRPEPILKLEVQQTSEVRSGGVGNLGTNFIIGFPECPIPGRLGIAQRQRQIGFGDLAENKSGQHASERRSRRDAAAIVATARDNVLGQPMKLRQAVPSHSNPAVPLVFELDPGELGKEPLERSTAPLWMNDTAQPSKRADAAEDQPTPLIQAQGAEDLLCIPNALPLGKDRPAQMVPEWLSRE